MTAAGSSNYVLSGTDRAGSVSGNDPSVTVQVGDTINFNMNAGGSHPFVIKTVQGTGTSNQVTTGTYTGGGSISIWYCQVDYNWRNTWHILLSVYCSQ